MHYKLTPTIILNDAEFSFSFIRAPGPGGQNVNKVASAVQLRFDVAHSPSLPESARARVLSLLSSKITTEGELVIKASSFRTQERNKHDAIDRLITLLRQAVIIPKKRKKTKPTYSSKLKRLHSKKLHASIKSLRGRNISHEQ